MNTARKLNFENTLFFIGLDVHKKNWTVTIRCNGIELRTYSMNPSPQELANHMKRNYPGGVYYCVYEAGFCGFWICRELNDLGLKCIVTNAADVPTAQKEKVNKKDPVDSRKLARELENGSLEPIYIPDIYHEQVRSLMRLRYKHVQQQTRIKNRIKSMLHYYGIPIPPDMKERRWSGAFIGWLRTLEFKTACGKYCLDNLLEQLTECRNHIVKTVRELKKESKSDKIAQIMKAILTVPGISFITAMTFYTEIIDMRRFKTLDKTANYVGLVPSTKSTGDNETDRGISFRKNKYLRYLIIEAAWVAVRKDPALTLKFNELIRRMSKQDAIIRIAKKLLNRIRHVWLYQTEYAIAVLE